jgi:transposase
MRKDRRKPIVRYYEGLPQIRANAAGMDIGAEEIWVDVGNKDEEGVRKFGTFTADLNEMAEWMKRCGIETVAMESTGVYWIAPFQILEAKGIEVFLVNARFAKNVQGRKNDMLDCQWIRLLHSYGLLPKSFRPVAEIAVLRSYLRHRQMLIQYAASHIQHMQKALTQMNVQLHHVISDITGSTGMRIIRAIVEGHRDPKQLAAMRDVRTKATEETIAKALEGDYRVEHVFALKQSLELFDSYQKQIQSCDEQIARHLGTLGNQSESGRTEGGTEREEEKAQSSSLQYPGRSLPHQRCRPDANRRHQRIGGPSLNCRNRSGHESMEEREAVCLVAGAEPEQPDQRRQGSETVHAQDGQPGPRSPAPVRSRFNE